MESTELIRQSVDGVEEREMEKRKFPVTRISRRHLPLRRRLWLIETHEVKEIERHNPLMAKAVYRKGRIGKCVCVSMGSV